MAALTGGDRSDRLSSRMEVAPEVARQAKQRRRDWGRVDLIFTEKILRCGRRGVVEWYGFLSLTDPNEAERMIRDTVGCGQTCTPVSFLSRCHQHANTS